MTFKRREVSFITILYQYHIIARNVSQKKSSLYLVARLLYNII
jgi:hypothetical protein